MTDPKKRTSLFSDRQEKKIAKDKKKRISLFSLTSDPQEKKDAKDKQNSVKHYQLDGRIQEFERVGRYFETNLLMHRLAASHFNARAKWLSFFPILFITSLTSILGIFATHYANLVGIEQTPIVGAETVAPQDVAGFNRTLQESMLSDATITYLAKSFLPLTVAILGVLSTFSASLGKYNNYQSKADMHLAAVNTLSSICDIIRVNAILLERSKTSLKMEKARKGSQEEEPEDQNKPFDGTIGGVKFDKDEVVECDIEKHKTAFNTVKESCTCPIPSRIENAFRELHWEFRPAPPKVRKHIYPRMYYALWKKIKKYEKFPRWNPLWVAFRFPICLPEIEINQFIAEEMGDEDYHYFLKKKENFIVEAQEMEPEEDMEKLEKEWKKEWYENNEAELKEELIAKLKKEMEAAEAEKKGTSKSKAEEEGSDTSKSGSDTSKSLDKEAAKKTGLTDNLEDLEIGGE